MLCATQIRFRHIYSGVVDGLALHDMPIKRIVGGQEASPNQFPWIVEVVDSKDEHKCGGSLIGTEWVITSASCMFFNFESHRKIKIGEYVKFLLNKCNIGPK